MGESDKKNDENHENDTWPDVDRRKGPRERRVPDSDRRSGDRVVTEEEPRRQKPDRRKK